MIKSNQNIVKFGKKKRKRKKPKWNSIEKLNCKSAEFNDINGIDFFYAVFHHERKNKVKLKEIINNINVDNKDNSEKMMTGKYMVRFTPILYSFTKKMINENRKEYRKFQTSDNYLNKRNFKSWLDSAHNATNDIVGVGQVILNIRKFWAVFFASFKTFKNFETFENEILGRSDKLSSDYTKYVKRLSDYGVPKYIDTVAITNTHHDNNLKLFTDFSIFSELWRLNKPIYCTYRSLFIECTKGIKQSDQCPFNNWNNFNFKKLKENDIEDISKYIIGDLDTLNDKQSIIGYINTGQDWVQDEMNRLVEQNNTTSRINLLENAESYAKKSIHQHGPNAPVAHTHTDNPLLNHNESTRQEILQAKGTFVKGYEGIFNTEGFYSNDPTVPSRLQDTGESRRKKHQKTHKLL